MGELMKILLAIDGSKYSEAAAETLSSAFRIQGTQVLVLQVIEPMVYFAPPQMGRGYAPEMTERLQDQMAKAKESVADTAEILRKAGFKTDSRVVENEVRTGILAVAEEYSADLIVLVCCPVNTFA